MADKPFDFKFGLVACALADEGKALSILHFCGYAQEPTQADIDAFTCELNSDPEFGLVGRVGRDVFVLPATDEICKHYLEIYGRHNTRN